MGAGASAPPSGSAYESAPHTRERRRSTNNVLGGAGTNDLILNSLCDQTKFDKSELKTLQASFIELAAKQGNPNTITEDEFREALASVGIVESDQVILHSLFSVMDKAHDGQVNFKDFVTSASVMVSGSIKDKLHFSFELYCGGGEGGTVAKTEMQQILLHLNNTASLFGDPHLTEEEITSLVNDVYTKHDPESTGTLSYAQYMSAVAENPVLIQFLSGKGTKKGDLTKKLVLPIWWIDFEFVFTGAMKGKVSSVLLDSVRVPYQLITIN
jgi:Ca2+-binding EF-hand superfamily protein